MGTKTIIHDPTRGWLLLTPDGQIEIAKEDLKDIVILGLWDEAEDHHPYSVDAEFEVKEQYRNTVFKDAEWHDYDPKLNGPKDAEPGEFEYRKIARLVKAKEHVGKPFGTESDRDWKEDYEQENGNYQNKCCKCDALFYGNKHRVVCKVCAKETESQHKLWNDMVEYIYVDDDLCLDYSEAKKRFRIERI